VFADAEHFAQLGNSVVYPVHLLYAVLLAEDKHRNATLAELNIEKKTPAHRFQKGSFGPAA
jgi:hypothetical protein